MQEVESRASIHCLSGHWPQLHGNSVSLFGFNFFRHPQDTDTDTHTVSVCHMSKTKSERVTCQKGPPNYCEIFTTGHCRPLWLQQKTSNLFSGSFSKLLKAFQFGQRDGQSEGRTDKDHHIPGNVEALKGCTVGP